MEEYTGKKIRNADLEKILKVLTKATDKMLRKSLTQIDLNPEKTAAEYGYMKYGSKFDYKMSITKISEGRYSIEADCKFQDGKEFSIKFVRTYPE